MYDGGDPKQSQERAEPPPRTAPWTDGLLGRALVQGVGMLGVAVLVMAVVDDRAADTDARIAALETRLDLVRLERDRMQRLSHELATELDDASMEAEIVRWQLAYTEERFARLESERDALVEGLPLPAPTRGDAWSPGPRATFVSLDPDGALPPDALGLDTLGPDTLGPDTLGLDHLGPGAFSSDGLPGPIAVVALADLAEDSSMRAFLDASSRGVDDTGLASMAAPSENGAPVHPTVLAFGPLGGFADPADLRPVGSQLDRDRAFAAWAGLLEEAATGECTGRGAVAERRCRDQVRRTLWSSGSRAVDCMLSGNAAPDYVSNIRLDQLPTHSQPLDKGAVIFCDGGLRNL